MRDFLTWLLATRHLWNIDYMQMGLGGDNSWGAKAHSEYLIPYMNYEYSFTLRPVVSGSSLNTVSKIIY